MPLTFGRLGIGHGIRCGIAIGVLSEIVIVLAIGIGGEGIENEIEFG